MVPAKLLNLLNTGPKKSNLEIVVDYLVSPGGTIELTDLQKQLLIRLESVDQLHSSGQYTKRELAMIHAKKHGQSVRQSERDIQDAETVFGSMVRFNKKAKIYRHYDTLQEFLIKLIREDDRENAIKLGMAITKLLDIMPQDKDGNRSTPQIIMNFSAASAAQIMDEPISEQEAEEIANKAFEIKGIKLEEEDDDA